MKTCIITGATGYIGSNLLKYLLTKGWNIGIITDPAFGYANIEDVKEKVRICEYKGNINQLANFFNELKPDVVYHLAAAVITNYKPEQVPVLIQSNIQFGTEVLEAARLSGTKYFVSTGSYWQNYNSDSYNPVDLYAATKEAFEKVMQFYKDAYGMKQIVLRLYDIYGENDKRPKLWNILKRIAGTDESIDISPAEQKLDMIHVSDVCSAYECAYELMASGAEFEPVYSVRTGEMHALKELVEMFQEGIGKPIKVNVGAKPYKDREVMQPTTVYPTLPNWRPKVSVKEGFSRFNF